MVVFHLVWVVVLAAIVKVIVFDDARPVASAVAAPESVAAARELIANTTSPQAATLATDNKTEYTLAARDIAGPFLTFEQQCEKTLAPTKVQVELAQQEVVYDFSHGIEALTDHARDHRDGVILGLTKNGLGTRFEWHMNLLYDPLTGNACMRPEIRMLVAYGAQAVYVAREFEPGGCAFKEVLEHENHHVNANRDQLALSALELRSVLKRTLGNRVFYGSPKELERQLTQAVNEYWLPVAKLKFSQSSPVHAEIDSDEGYRDVYMRCEGEFSRVLRSLQRQPRRG